ncbi:MAG: ArsR family transcriptional regulator [Methanoregulaceae archaeon]|nr:ArsR family transcriptional regulator [Methanoregulaceae archaeon]
MKICIIYHSYSGITRGVAEKLKASCGGDLVEVKPRKDYTTLTAYTLGCRRAMKREADPVHPDSIDVSSYDIIVIGTPVWAWKATPVINGAIAALEGSEEKSAVIFVTCGGKPGETIPVLKEALSAKGVRIVGEKVFVRRDADDPEKIGELASIIRSAGNTG